MTLRQIVNELDTIDDDLVIFARKTSEWMWDEHAALVVVSDVDKFGVQLEELTYFLEVETAKEVLEVWRNWHYGKEPSEEERFAALRYYADHDAYLPN
jgi:hypothetical protein